MQTIPFAYLTNEIQEIGSPERLTWTTQILTMDSVGSHLPDMENGVISVGEEHSPTESFRKERA